MGTGAVNLGRALMPTEFGNGKGEATMLLSHTHWDHIQGFPFFPPIFVAGNRFNIYGAARSSSMLEGILEGQMNPHFSPIYTPKNLGATIAIHSIALEEPTGRRRPLVTDAVKIRALATPHGS